MITEIHQSTLSMALRCGEQLRRRYILNQIIPPSIPAARGTALHRANEINLRQKIRTSRDMPAIDLKDAARDAYYKTLRDGVFLPRAQYSEKNKLLNDGLNQCLSLTDLYHREVAPEIVPIEVEREFNIDVGLDLPLAGRIDHEQNNRVDDLKTATRSWNDQRIFQEVQPIFYSYAHEHEFGNKPEFQYHILIALKNSSKRQVFCRTCTDRDYQSMITRIEMFLHMLKMGVFLPAAIGSWVCSEKWCGYYTTCRYVGNQPAKQWI